ncbi:transmembrane 9 superfamily member 3 [Clonorchis sinensis]|uniref:Transmembrane 9 superfamily member n=1 Tax=Clonorchis sinensis TaxID=79923 RepID=H2KPG0_CLOSI|nr:transmembrane 9 superfamily member 3 [Clonorchis sinensis]
MSPVFLVLLLVPLAYCDEHDHVYTDGEEVVLWMNTIGPYRNRQETYPFYSLPLCRGPKQSIEHAHETLGEALLGIELQYSGIDIRFKVNVTKTPVCTLKVDDGVYASLQNAIANQYWYQMYMDDLPIWSVLGESAGRAETYIWTHKDFTVEYNGNQIIKVVLMNTDLVPVHVGSPISFTYQVTWIPSSVPFEDRFNHYLDFDFFEHKDRELGDEYGWKQVHGDVFRQPAYPGLLASVIGSGAHLAIVSCVVLLLAVTNRLYTERGGFMSTAIFVFAASAPINGMVGGSLYAQMSGKKWIRQFLLGSTLLPILTFAAAFLVNLVAVYYQTSRSIPFLTMLAVVAILLFVIVPLNLVGTVLGRNLCGQANYPCRINSVPRPIPEKKWFMEPGFLILVTGMLPFGSIFIELYFIFTSFWAYKIYFVFGFTLLVLLLLMAVCSSVSAVGTYFLLNSEDYRWQWTSFMSGASISIYAYLYSAYYFIFKTKMNGFFQTSFFFVYMGLFCMYLGVLCGSVAYLAASRFVRKIYSTVKVD